MKCLVGFSLILILFVGSFVTAQTQQPQQQPSWMQSLAVDDQDTLQVYIDPGSVQIVPNDKKEVHVTGTGMTEEEASGIKWESKNRKIQLDYRGEKSTKPVQFEIQVPSSFNLNLYVSSDLSSASPIGGDVKLTTDSGDIDLTDVNGSITASTASGEIYMKNVQGSAILTAKDGDIDVEVVTGDLDMNNEDGDSYAKKVQGNLNASSTDGDVTIGETNGSATITTEIGDVMIKKATGLTAITTSGGDIDMSESDNSIVLTTGDGDITIDKVAGPFEVKTNSGEVSAKIIPGRTGKGKITSRSGDIEVYVPETAAVTIFANVRDSSESDSEGESDAIESDFTPSRNDHSGREVRNEYRLNGGGDTILIETTTGTISINKLIGQN
jgi:hypothetical protein